MARTLQPESRISHYRIIGPLGAGGMGEVYRAQDETLGRDVALKILPPDLVRNEDRVRRFILEAKSASSLNHPNIITIYEVGKDVVRDADGAQQPSLGGEPVHFIAMELVSGKTLKDLVHQEKSDLRTVLGYLAQAAEGLAKAHAAGIVHRDLKPGNIMVSHDGYAKVLDFGLAKLTERSAGDQEATSAPTSAGELTDGGVVLGTVGYMSPEQVRGSSVDHRSDIFSFGCMLYEVSTGRRPFAADSHIDTMHAIVHDKPPPIDAVNPATPSELRRLIRRCMEKNPDQRLQSSKDLALELREIVDDYDALSASATSGSAITAPPPRRRRNPIVLGAVGIAAALGLAAIGFWLASQRSSGDRDASTRDDPFQSTRMSILMSPKDLVSATLSGDGRYLAYIVGPAGQWSLRVRQVATGSDVTVLPPQKDPIRGISFSPDGNYLYYLAQDPETPIYSALFEIPSLGGTPRKRLFDVDSPVGFSPDGRRATFVRGMPHEQRSVMIDAELSTGKERILASVPQPDNMPFVTPSWSPDGTKVVTPVNKLEGGIRSTVVSFDAADGQSQTLTGEEFGGIEGIGWAQGGRGLVIVGTLRDATFSQIYYVALPEGRLQRITNDLDNWTDLSMTADGAAIAAVRRSRTGSLWLTALDGTPRELTAGGGAENIGDVRAAADGTILFTAQQDQGRILVAMQPDGSQRRALTSGSQIVFGPHLLPNDTGVAFTAMGGEDRVAHIQRVNLDGSGLTQLTNEGGELLEDISAVGRILFFRRLEKATQLWRMSIDGGQPELVSDDPVYTVVGCSRDGRFLAYSTLTEMDGRQREIYKILPAAGGEPVGEILTPGAATNIVWVPDGSALSYIAVENGVANIWRQPVPSGTPTRITRFTDGRIDDHEWSRDGNRLLFQRTVAENHSLWLVNQDGGDATQLTDFRSGAFFSYEFSNDQRSVVFVHGDERSDVVMIRAATDASR